jgi:hypothetical protein
MFALHPHHSSPIFDRVGKLSAQAGLRRERDEMAAPCRGRWGKTRVDEGEEDAGFGVGWH